MSQDGEIFTSRSLWSGNPLWGIGRQAGRKLGPCCQTAFLRCSAPNPFWTQGQVGICIFPLCKCIHTSKLHCTGWWKRRILWHFLVTKRGTAKAAMHFCVAYCTLHQGKYDMHRVGKVGDPQNQILRHCCNMYYQCLLACGPYLLSSFVTVMEWFFVKWDHFVGGLSLMGWPISYD